MSSEILPPSKKTQFTEVEYRPSCLIVKLVGPSIGQRESPIVVNEVEPYIAQAGANLKRFVLDLSSVNFMSSMGIGAAVAFRNKAAAHGATTILYGMSPELGKMLALMRIDRLYKIAANEAELRKLLA
ncbi:MAG: anti-sigma factor antagonist [Phycisphaerales bacterium]|nr:anti-sigma factor antagonist [Phycisphaerales bacterium]